MQSTSDLKHKPVRKQGFSLINGTNYFQIGAMVFVPFDGALEIYLQSLRFNIILILPSFLLFFMVISSFIMATSIDPTDPLIYKKEILPQQTVTYCVVCESIVQSGSKHCGSCNRCTARFDHHCIWLNNCVGSGNYRYFISLVTSLLIFKMIKLGTDIYYLIDPPSYEAFWLVCVFILIDIFIVIALSNLLCMHVYFKIKNITTWDYIRMKRENALKQQVYMDANKQSSLKNYIVDLQNSKDKNQQHAQQQINIETQKQLSSRVLLYKINQAIHMSLTNLEDNIQQEDDLDRKGIIMIDETKKQKSQPDILQIQFNRTDPPKQSLDYQYEA